MLFSVSANVALHIPHMQYAQHILFCPRGLICNFLYEKRTCFNEQKCINKIFKSKNIYDI